jgi:hypothetical protein
MNILMTNVTLSSFIIEDTNDHTKDKLYVLKKDLALILYIINNDDEAEKYQLYNDEYNIFGFGKTLEEAIMDAEAELAVSFDVYSKTDDEDLTPKAKIMKYKFLDLV